MKRTFISCESRVDRWRSQAVVLWESQPRRPVSGHFRGVGQGISRDASSFYFAQTSDDPIEGRVKERRIYSPTYYPRNDFGVTAKIAKSEKRERFAQERGLSRLVSMW